MVGHPSLDKTDESVNWVKELVLKTRRIAIHEVDNVLGIHLGYFRAFWKTERASDWLICTLLADWGAEGKFYQHMPWPYGGTWKRPRFSFEDNHARQDVLLCKTQK